MSASADTTSRSTGDPGRPDVVHLPDYTDENPYQRRLVDALREDGLAVELTGGGGRGAPILRAVGDTGRPAVLHVHFLHQFLSANGDRLPRTVTLLLGVRTLLELLLLRAAGTTLVWTVHDVVDHQRPAPRLERLFKHVCVRFVFDEVVVHCASARGILAEEYRLPESAIADATVVPHGNYLGEYPEEVSRAEARAELGLPDDAFVYAFFGLIKQYKNVPMLVEAFDAVEDASSRLLVAGNPATEGLRETLEAAASDDDRIRLTLEYVPTPEVQYYLRAADAVVVPLSASNGSVLTSGSVVLAMGFGRPVVVPDVGCLAETVGPEGGFTYPPGAGLDGLRAAMERAREADTDALGRNNRERMARLDWRHVATLTRRVYEGT